MVFLISYISDAEEGGDDEPSSEVLNPANDAEGEGEERREEEVYEDQEDKGEKWGMWEMSPSLISS